MKIVDCLMNLFHRSSTTFARKIIVTTLHIPISSPKGTSMSDATELYHTLSSALVSDFNSLKTAILGSPEVASAVSTELSTLEATVNTAAAAGAAALAVEATAIPVIGPAVSAAVVAAGPTLIADLQDAETKLVAFIAGLVSKS
jgi:hypothetical protein